MDTPHLQVFRLLRVLLIAFALGLVATYLTRAVARAVGFVAKPRADRWHSRPTALAGGVGIFVAFALVSSFVSPGSPRPVLFGASAMFALGLIDDIWPLKPYAKLAGQFLVAALTVASGEMLPWTRWVLVDQAITIFWIVGIANAINLLDNMDGLAGGIACISALFQGIFFYLHGSFADAGVCAALAGALGGFLVFNFNPASIFMGDGGSLFLGYTLATLAMHQDYGRSRSLVAVIAAPVLLLLIPIFDTTFVTITRIVRGRPVSQGGRDHTSHRLVTLGLSERRAVLVLWLIATFAGSLAVFARLGHSRGVWITLPLLVVGLAFIAIHLARTDAPAPGSNRPAGLLASVAVSLSTFAYKLRILEVLLDVSLAMVSLMAAFLLRFDGDLPDEVALDLARVFPVIAAVKIFALLLSGAYDGIWRHVGLRDLVRLTRGTLIGSVATIVLVTIWIRFGSLSRGALIIDGLLFTALVTGSRVSFRALRMFLSARRAPAAKRVLLWGAGDGGALVLHQLLESHRTDMVPVGFVDDDRLKIGRSIHGLRVLGSSNDLEQLLAKHSVDQVLVTSFEIAQDRIVSAVERLGEDKIRRLRISVDAFMDGSSEPQPRSA